jgi:hypothetical protein
MAKNRKGGGRIGAVRGRTQFQLPSGHYAKRDSRTGEILSIKADLKPYKGIVREKPLQKPVARQTARIAFPPIRAWEWSVRRNARPSANPVAAYETSQIRRG